MRSPDLLRDVAQTLDDVKKKIDTLRSLSDKKKKKALVLLEEAKNNFLNVADNVVEDNEELANFFLKRAVKLKNSTNDKTIEKMELRAFEKYDYIVMIFKDVYSWINAVQYFGLRKVDLFFVKTRKKIGLGRVIDGAKLLQKLQSAGIDFVTGSEQDDNDA